MIYIALFLMFFVLLSIVVLSNEENSSSKEVPYVGDTDKEIKKKIKLILSNKSPKWKLFGVNKQGHVMYRETGIFGCKRHITFTTNVSKHIKSGTIYLRFEDNDEWDTSYDLTIVDEECAYLLNEIIGEHSDDHKKFINKKL